MACSMRKYVYNEGTFHSIFFLRRTTCLSLVKLASLSHWSIGYFKCIICTNVTFAFPGINPRCDLNSLFPAPFWKLPVQPFTNKFCLSIISLRCYEPVHACTLPSAHNANRANIRPLTNSNFLYRNVEILYCFEDHPKSIPSFKDNF